MNTVKSFWIGWGSLCIAGGAAYYFAKQSINADRQTRYEAEQKRRRMAETLEYSGKGLNKQSHSASSKDSSIYRRNDYIQGEPPRNDLPGSLNQETSSDPAPTGHTPESEGQRIRERSKYEASEPYRTRKGDRFS